MNKQIENEIKKRIPKYTSVLWIENTLVAEKIHNELQLDTTIIQEQPTINPVSTGRINHYVGDIFAAMDNLLEQFFTVLVVDKEFTEEQEKYFFKQAATLAGRVLYITKKEPNYNYLQSFSFIDTTILYDGVYFTECSHHQLDTAKILVAAPVSKNKMYSFKKYLEWIKKQNYPHIEVALITNGEGKHELRTEIGHLLAINEIKGFVTYLSDDQEKTFKQKMHEARQELLKYAKIKDYTHLLWLDTDTIPPTTDLIRRLLRWNKRIVSGLYFYKESTSPLAIDLQGCRNIKLEPLRDAAENNELLEVRAVGLGCCLVHFSVFDVGFNYAEGLRKIDGELKEYYGEDFLWCDAQRKQGRKIYLDPSMLCKHYSERDIQREEQSNSKE